MTEVQSIEVLGKEIPARIDNLSNGGSGEIKSEGEMAGGVIKNEDVGGENNSTKVIADDIDTGPHRGGEDDMLEGTEIKSSTFEDNWSDSSSEDEESDIIFQTCSSSSTQRRFEKVSTAAYNRTNTEANKAAKDDQKTGGNNENSETSSESLKPLRFSYHRTAFDVDIDELDETPWRELHTDISDYFNYGFSETTWNLYCAKQLKLRAERGDGPAPPPPPAPTPTPAGSDPNVTNANELQSAMFLNQLQNNIRPQHPTLVPGGQYLPTPSTSILHNIANQATNSNQPPPQPPHSSPSTHQSHHQSQSHYTGGGGPGPGPSSHGRHDSAGGDHNHHTHNPSSHSHSHSHSHHSHSSSSPSPNSSSRGSHHNSHGAHHYPDDRYDGRDRYSKRGRY